MRLIPTATLLLLLSPALGWADIVYNVEPFDLGGGYMISGGTITTDMAATTITSFSVEVTGPVPYLFSSASAVPSTVNQSAFDITPHAITVNIDGTFPGGPHFANADNTAPTCNFCEQELSWDREFGSIEYRHLDLLDFNPEVQQLVMLPVGIHTVATAVPEPSAFLCLSVVGCVGVGRRWWRKRRTQV